MRLLEPMLLPKKQGGLSVQKWTSDYILSARANLIPLVTLSCFFFYLFFVFLNGKAAS